MPGPLDCGEHQLRPFRDAPRDLAVHLPEFERRPQPTGVLRDCLHKVEALHEVAVGVGVAVVDPNLDVLHQPRIHRDQVHANALALLVASPADRVAQAPVLGFGVDVKGLTNSWAVEEGTGSLLARTVDRVAPVLVLLVPRLALAGAVRRARGTLGVDVVRVDAAFIDTVLNLLVETTTPCGWPLGVALFVSRELLPGVRSYKLTITTSPVYLFAQFRVDEGMPADVLGVGVVDKLNGVLPVANHDTLNVDLLRIPLCLFVDVEDGIGEHGDQHPTVALARDVNRPACKLPAHTRLHDGTH